jgi:hypothetical protein
MITVHNGPKNNINWEISVSANLVVATLKTLGFPVDISAKLHKIGEHSTNKVWRLEAAALLVALSGKPSSQFLQVMRTNKADVIQILDRRYTATLDRKQDPKANTFKNSSFTKQLIVYAQEVVMQSITIEKVGR